MEKGRGGGKNELGGLRNAQLDSLQERSYNNM